MSACRGRPTKADGSIAQSGSRTGRHSSGSCSHSAATALRSGMKRDRILNFMSKNELLDWAAYLRDTQGRAAESIEK